MATTTNYGWTTPDDTALVKDGASAIRTLGSSIDTSVKSLSPGTTAGDLDYYTSSTAKARLAIGSTGQVLTVAGGVPSWATSSSGSMTLLSTTTLSGATVTISSISQSYNSLYAVVSGVTNATGNGFFQMKPNNLSNSFGSAMTGSNVSNTNDDTINITQNFTTFNNSGNSFIIQFDNYASATTYKPFSIYGGYHNVSFANYCSTGQFGYVRANTAITSLVFLNSGGNLSTGTVLLYGVK